MKYAICNELYGDWPFDKAFAHAKARGYSGVEIAPFTINDDVRDIGSNQRNEISELARKHQLEIIGLHWLLAKTEGFHLTHPEPAVRERTANYLGELARLCRDLGGHVMVFGSPGQRNLLEGVTYSEAFDNAVDVLTQASPRLEEFDVTLALEPLGPEEGDFLLTAASAIELAKAVDSPKVKLHLDVKAMSTEPTSIPDIIHASREWLVHFHANDPNRLGPGMGEIEYRPIFEALKSIGYDGWLSVEVFDYSPGVDTITERSIRYMREVDTKTTGNENPSDKP